MKVALCAVLLWPADVVSQETALLSMGELIDLELMHHVNSRHTVPGSSLYFRVVDDHVVKGTVVIRAGTVVRGTMEAATKNKAFGRAGKMGIVLGNLKAVDGTSVPLDAEIQRKGRTRYGATVGMAFTFGLAGLFTRGRAAYLEKGEIFSARVSADREIVPEDEPEGDALPEYPTGGTRIALVPERPVYVLKIEKREKIKPVVFRAADAAAASASALRSLQLVSVNGMRLPEPVSPTRSLVYDGWSLLSHCDDGSSELLFEGELDDGQPILATATLTLEVKRKGK